MNKPFFLTTSWDDAALTDNKLVKLLLKYDIPATFYMPISNIERKNLSKKNIKLISKYFEIGAHTITHRYLTKISDSEMQKEIHQGKQMLEEFIGKKIYSFCYPGGKFNENIKSELSLAGFRYARTTSIFGTMVGDKFEAPTTIHAYDHNPLVYVKNGMQRKLFYHLIKKGLLLRTWDELALESFYYCKKNGGVFHLWGHSWEIDRNDQWDRLENLFKTINCDVSAYEKGSNIQVLDYLSNLKSLYYSSKNVKAYESSLSAPYFRKEYNILSKYIKGINKNGSFVLDIGCGIGRLSNLFKNTEYLGVDASDNFIKFAKKKYGNKKILFRLADYRSLFPKLKKRFDLILFWGIFEDETSPLDVVEKTLPKLRSKGQIIFTIHNNMNPFFRLFSFIKTEWQDNNFPYTAFSYDSFSAKIKDFASKNNLRIMIYTYGLIPPFIKEIPAIRGGKYGNTIVVILKK